MKTRKCCVLAAILAACLVSAHAEPQAAGSDSVIAPFPSKLFATIKGGDVLLSWQDSPDVKTGYAVYRGSSTLDTKSFPAAVKLGEVKPGVMSYTDKAPPAGAYYYAVLALAEDGSPYPIFIQARNATLVAMTIAAAATPAAAAKPATAPKPIAPLVTGIGAKAKGDAILVSYAAPPKSRLVLYRGLKPIAVAADLLDATLVAAFADKDGSFADYPVPGVDYYYALLGEEDLKEGSILLSLGGNSLKKPVQVKAAAVASGFGENSASSRTPPLPYFLVEDGKSDTAVADEGGPQAERSIAPETAKAISSILAKTPEIKTSLPQAAILPEDRDEPTGGEDYSLSLIVRGQIAQKDWNAAIEQLRKYLSLNRSPNVQARAHFYLGEALASTGAERDAFFEFLSARDFYPVETKPWIEYSLRALNPSE
jgi:hypothetical protein